MKLEGVDRIYPLTPLQKGLLFESLLHPESGAYFNQMLASLDARADLDLLRRAWRHVTQQQEILRTSFVWEGIKEPVQVVDTEVDIPWEVLDWTDVDTPAREARFDQLLHRERERGFDLSRAPLMRFNLVRQGDEGTRLVWSFHHLLLDGWSMYLVLQDVFAAYGALVRGHEPKPHARPPFRRYVSWARGADLEAAEGYWRRRLAGVSPKPLSVGRPEARGMAEKVEDSRWVTRTLPKSSTDRLVRMCRERHLTLNSAVMGAWALVLSRYTDRDDVVFGTTVSGRSPELEGSDEMIGLLINTLPVRAHVRAEASVANWLSGIQAEQAEQRQFEYSPLYDIQGWCDLPSDQSLFDTVYLFENYRKDTSLEDLGAGVGLKEVDWYERTNYPLAVLAVPGEELSVKAIYHRQSFSETAVSQLLRHWLGVLERFADDPDARVGEVPVLDASERTRIIEEWNRTDVDVDLSTPVHGLVERQARTRPTRTAVVDGDTELSYAELDARASAVAARLIRAGTEPGDFVAVCMERSPELIVSVLAVLKAGAAYVPLDPASPPDRLAFMLGDSNADVLLTSRALAASLPSDATGTMTLLFTAEVDEGDAEDTGSQVAPDVDSTAYMIFTSGSTGRPKGTPITHASLLNLVAWHRRAFAVDPDDRATQVAGPGFDAFGWEIWPYLTCGASVAVIPGSVAVDPESLRDWLVREAVTISFLPTPLAERVLTLPWPDDAPLRRLLTGGDRLRKPPPPGLPFTLVNNYGPTESTVVTTSCVVDPGGDDDVPPIGRPIDNTRVYVLDRHLRPVPVGVPGELHIGGKGLTPGYHGRPDLTTEKFIDDPFGPDPGGRLYKTGDLTAFRPDGSLDFLGRIDFQVKIRGFRVELGEIEAALSRRDDVSEAVVLATETGRLVAYLVGAGARPEESALRESLRSHLPDYMVPSHYQWLAEIPLTPNGKVDRRALPEPDSARPDIDVDYVAPASPTEKAVAEIWKDVLGLSRVGRNDNFFELGGHSLSITEVFGRLRRDLSVDLALVDLFNYPTVATVATRIDGDDPTPDAGAKKGHDRAATRREAMRRRRSGRNRPQGPSGEEASS